MTATKPSEIEYSIGQVVKLRRHTNKPGGRFTVLGIMPYRTRRGMRIYVVESHTTRHYTTVSAADIRALDPLAGEG